MHRFRLSRPPAHPVAAPLAGAFADPLASPLAGTRPTGYHPSMADIASILADAAGRQRSSRGAPSQAQTRDQGKIAVPPADPRPSSDRTVKDTVILSDGGQKIVNLERGNELAAEIRNRPVDDGFFAALARARQDVLRIGRLFTETIKAAFQQARK